MTTMAFGLEARVPFLDHRLVEYVLSLPVSSQMTMFTGKKLLRKIAEKRLPSKIAKRKKHGFVVPVGKWFRTDLKDMLIDTILSSSSRGKDFFNRSYLEKITREHISGSKDYSQTLWVVFCFCLWCENFEK
jgi:asparagine synthase (glutamine-hydrolysing)